MNNDVKSFERRGLDSFLRRHEPHFLVSGQKMGAVSGIAILRLISEIGLERKRREIREWF